jgi:hypothetical protein
MWKAGGLGATEGHWDGLGLKKGEVCGMEDRGRMPTAAEET